MRPTPHPIAARSAGFTLIEVLVTLFVIAVIAGIAVVRTGDRRPELELEREAQRLQRVLELARREALAGGEEWGLELTREGYGLLILDGETGLWDPAAEGRDAFAAHALPEGVTLRLRIEDRNLAPEVLGPLRGRHRPALLLLSSGEMTPFSLRVEQEDRGGGDDLVWILSSDGYGAVRLERGEDRGPASTIFSARPEPARAAGHA